MNEYDVRTQQGWQCPVCKRVYAPSVTMCIYCGQDNVITSESITNIMPKSHENWLEDIAKAYVHSGKDLTVKLDDDRK